MSPFVSLTLEETGKLPCIISHVVCVSGGGMNWEITQGTLLSALWWPKWEGNPKKKGYTYMYSCFALLYSRN